MTGAEQDRPTLVDRGDLERPGALPAAAAELGALAARRELDVDRLRRLASPEVLDVLFRVALGTSLRRGPAAAPEVGDPPRLLALAAGASGAGALPVATVADLRSTLDAVEEELRSSGAWSPDAPVWWFPLPAPEGLEALWGRLAGGPAEGAPVGLPPEAGVRAAFPAEAGGSRWLAWPGALPAPLLEEIAAELDGAATAGALPLVEAGVGSSDRRSSRRSDRVRYLSGLEPEILSRAPTLGVVVQHVLHRLEAPLRLLLPGVEVHAPQTAMLARYRAPCPGFARHFDNPGGDRDNGRAITLILYLNPPQRPCRGGGLALWRPDASAEEAPAAIVPPAGGSAVLFDARAVAHAVEPLEPGADRWTLVLWLSDRPRRPLRPLVPVRPTTAAEALQPLDDPPVAPGAVLFRPVDPGGAAAGLAVHRPDPGRRPRAGIVATVRGGGAALDGWCRHHLALGFDHLLLVLDEGAGEEEAGALEELRRSLGRDLLTVWTDREAGRRRRHLPRYEGREELLAAADRGPATWAVAARQALNASAALLAARSGDASPWAAAGIEWLVHLDGDELLLLEGPGRGGATLAGHFAAAEAAGWDALRYLNHELLLPWREGEPARFKRNPALAALRLGAVGWRRLARYLGVEQDGRRPYFRAYWNGKSAVRVAAGVAAAGVHGWHVAGAPAQPLVAGPSVLHFHLPTEEAFRRKYLLAAGADGGPDDPARLFPASPLERAAASLLGELRRWGAGPETVAERLDLLYREMATFTPEEIELLDEAGLLFTPGVAHPPVPEAAAAGRA